MALISDLPPPFGPWFYFCVKLFADTWYFLLGCHERWHECNDRDVKSTSVKAECFAALDN